MNVELQDAIGQILTWRYTFVATVMVLVHEYIITIDDEVEYIWSRPRSTFTVLWVLLRYPFLLSFVMSTVGNFTSGWSQKMATAWMAIATILSFASLITGHGIFLLRTYALYSRARFVLVLCLPLFAAESAFAFYTVYVQVMNQSEYSATSWQSLSHNDHFVRQQTLVHGMGNLEMPHMGACSPTDTTACLGLMTWTLPFLFDMVVTGLTLHRSFLVYRRTKMTPLLTVLLRDGTIYFVVSSAVYAAAIIVLLVSPDTFYGAFSNLPIAIIGIMAMRLSLNLRKVQPERLPSSSLARPSFGVLTGLDEVIDEMTDLGDETVRFGRPRRSFAWTPLHTFRLP